MAHAETSLVQEFEEAIDSSIKLLEDHAILINRLYERGLANFDEAIHFHHLNKRLSEKLRKARRAAPQSVVRQAA